MNCSVNSMINFRRLVFRLLDQYELPVWGTHGVSHWARVWENGLRLATITGADTRVVKLFAVFHDARRRTEGRDFTHGRMGAELAAALRASYFEIPDDDFELLYTACADHTNGKTHADITIQTCWDADRLDLGRVGKMPDPDRLCTDAAKAPETIAWANQRSMARVVPDLIFEEWGLGRPEESCPSEYGCH